MKRTHFSLVKFAMISVLVAGLSGCLSTLCTNLLNKGKAGAANVPICGS